MSDDEIARAWWREFDALVDRVGREDVARFDRQTWLAAKVRDLRTGDEPRCEDCGGVIVDDRA